eukprot:scaffold11460_cov15-Prasinocladus_malaysianus.AAC.1
MVRRFSRLIVLKSGLTPAEYEENATGEQQLLTRNEERVAKESIREPVRRSIVGTRHPYEYE